MMLLLSRSLTASRWLVFVTALLLSACGGGSSATSAGNVVPISIPGNVVPISIRQLASNNTTLTANTPYVDVTICAPSGVCQTVRDVLIDTGSSGLRLFASALTAQMQTALPMISATTGGQLAACAQFASGYAWGSMRQATIRIGGKATSTAVPIQLMNDPGLPAAPAACAGQGVDFASSFAGIANGILGISNFKYDCGQVCAQSTRSGFYYTCSNGNCSLTTAALAQQGINPVAAFATDNNGSILQLPAVPLPNGAPSADGTLTFGIGTQSNNTLTAAQLYPLDSQGNLKLSLSGVVQTGFVDSGSNAFYLDLSGVPTCSNGFYCPSTTLNGTVQLQTASGVYGSMQPIYIGDAKAMFATQNAALPALGGPAAIAGLVDLGLPYFYGRAIATGLEGTNTSAPNGYLLY